MGRLIGVMAVLALAFRISHLEAQSLAARTDSVFAAYARTDAPGCAVGIDSAGMSLVRRGYGMAELEFGAPIGVTTIFEAGSVSKQFTAAAVLLLAARGTLSLDDTLQHWFPEIPTYQAPITIRHLMLHSSGLRDWGSVASLAGWPRGQRAHTHADALAIIARQQGINHDPGAAFSYTNSGYNLMAMLVERAANMSFADFTRRELFAPLGMTSTSWRDDFTRLVPGRAQAYAPAAGTWKLAMPFEFVHGNGGLLTTVDDLLTWTRALHEGRIGRPDVTEAMKTPGTFNDGTTMPYGGGLFIGPIRGADAIYHGGATAGYRSVLATFLDTGITVAILCNRADANTIRLGERLVEGSVAFAARPTPTPGTPPAAFRADPAGYVDYVGTWHSDEADATLTIRIDRGALVAARRPGLAGPIRPTAEDMFQAPGGVEFRFVRDGTGRPAQLHLSVTRARNVRFDRVD
jgi:CubicO group peptidase (beta-lactamase class C family)